MMPLAFDLDGFDPQEHQRALLDRIAAEGIAPVDARAFATWLEGMFEAMGETATKLATLEQDYRDYVDAHPDQDSIVPKASDLYHPNKQVAEQLAQEWMEADKRIRTYRVQFESYNGWVIVLYPGLADLTAYANKAEIADGRAIPKPEGKQRPTSIGLAPTNGPKPKAQGGSGQPSSAPTKGATAKVWEIADRVHAASGLDRGKIIAACEAEGINTSTAGTQYSKWKKAKGY